jgi:hypothetical protein
MSTFTIDARAQKVWFDADNMWISFTDWDAIDEDISVPNLLIGYYDRAVV